LALPSAVGRARRLGLALPFARSAAFWLVVIILAGAGLRLLWTQAHDFFPLGGDGRWYLVVARNVAEGRGYVVAFDEHGREVAGAGEPTAFMPPGYPLALAGAFKVFGPGMTAATHLNIALEAATIGLVFLLGRSLANARAGLLAAALYALLPEPLFSSEFAISEFLFTTLLMAALAVLLGARRPPGLWPAVAFGLLAGLAVLTRGQGIVLLPAAFLFWLLRDGRRPAARSLGLAIIGLLLVVGPWAVRNAIVLDGFAPVSTNAGINLRIGHSPDADGRYFWPEPIDATDGWNTLYHANQPGQEVRRSRIYTERAIDYALSHPREELALAARKLFWLFRVDPENELVDGLSTLGATPIEPALLRSAVAPLVAATHYPLLALAVLALVLWLRSRRPEALLLASVVVLWALFHVAFFAQPRYHLPLLPLFCIAAAWLLTHLPALSSPPPASEPTPS
jgi:4-amino-4-deoxy-L-arabinose transferase-like glycosyltransferase